MWYFLIFAQNIDCGYTLEPSTHDLCFRAKRRKNVYPGKPHFSYIKVGCKGVFITRTCFHDDYFACLQYCQSLKLQSRFHLFLWPLTKQYQELSKQSKYIQTHFVKNGIILFAKMFKSPMYVDLTETKLQSTLFWTATQKKTKERIFKTDNHLMQVKSIAECARGAFCNTLDLH